MVIVQLMLNPYRLSLIVLARLLTHVVKKASETHGDDNVSAMGESQNSKRKAKSGSVGSFMKI